MEGVDGIDIVSVPRDESGEEDIRLVMSYNRGFRRCDRVLTTDASIIRKVLSCPLGKVLLRLISVLSQTLSDSFPCPRPMMSLSLSRTH